MSQLTDAYVAGLIDGEGCVHVWSREKGGRRYYSTKVEVGMTKPALPLLQSMRRAWGGSLNKAREATDRWEEAWAWVIQGPDAAQLLRRIEPYLQIKMEQARLGIRLEDIKATLPKAGRGVAWSDHARAHAARIRRRVMELNAKGPALTPPITVDGMKPFARLVAGVWVTDQADLFSDLGWEQYSKTWPTSGMTRSGVAYELPTSAPATAGSGSSSLPCLPTPQARDGDASSWSMSASTAAKRMGQGKRNLDDAVALLPTPTARDGPGRGYPGPNYEAHTGRPLDETILSLFSSPPLEPPTEPRADPISEAPAAT